MANEKTPRTRSTRTRAAAPKVRTADVHAVNLEGEIRRRAYELFEQRGCAPGHEHDDWFVAEREVLAHATPHNA
jgi:hypothetical protein